MLLATEVVCDRDLWSKSCAIFVLQLFVLIAAAQDLALLPEEEMPSFAEGIPNITVPVGRDAQLPCVVTNLGSYRSEPFIIALSEYNVLTAVQAAWLRVEDKGILTIHQHIITRNYRVSLAFSDNKNFVLHIKNIQESDRGGYMCQINTVPMKSQVGFLDVVVPPDILLEESSSDIVAAEGSDVNLRCKAKGLPTPTVKWRREDNVDIPLSSGKNNKKFFVHNVTGDNLNITRVSRIHMGAWLCVASNGVPPSVSRRILLHVHFAPAIWIPNLSVGGALKHEAVLDCHIEAYPSSTNYWIKETGENIEASEKYEIKVERRSYKTHLQLVIKNLQPADFGVYKCLAKNPLGAQEREMRLIEAGSSGFAKSQVKQGQRERVNQLERTSFNDFQSPSKVPVNQQRAMYSGASFETERAGHENKQSSSAGLEFCGRSAPSLLVVAGALLLCLTARRL